MKLNLRGTSVARLPTLPATNIEASWFAIVAKRLETLFERPSRGLVIILRTTRLDR